MLVVAIDVKMFFLFLSRFTFLTFFYFVNVFYFFLKKRSLKISSRSSGNAVEATETN